MNVAAYMPTQCFTTSTAFFLCTVRICVMFFFVYQALVRLLSEMWREGGGRGVGWRHGEEETGEGGSGGGG